MKWGAERLVLHFLLKNFGSQKCTFSWDTCIKFARTHKENPAEETCMHIFSSTISRRIWYLSKIKHHVSAKNCIFQRTLKSERIWSNFCTNSIGGVFLWFCSFTKMIDWGERKNDTLSNLNEGPCFGRLCFRKMKSR